MSRRVRFEEIQEGFRLPEFRVKMERDTYLAYNRLVNEINPLHFDRAYAVRLGFRDIVVAGVYTFSFIPRLLEEGFGFDAEVSGIEIKFQEPVYIEETIVHTARVIRKVSEGSERYLECEVSVTNGQGNELTAAVVRVDFPRPAE